MNNKLKMISGGLKSKEEAPREFFSAYASKSRLMGGVWLVVHWLLHSTKNEQNLIQYFYLDCDEFGIEDFHNLYDPNPLKLKQMDNSTIDCMGSNKVSLPLSSVITLISYYDDMAQKSLDSPLENRENYKFILDMKNSIPEKRFEDILHDTEISLCSFPTNDTGIINYALMRGFAKDLQVVRDLFFDELSFKNFERECYKYTESFSNLIKTELKEIHPKTKSENSIMKHYQISLLIEQNNNHFLIFATLSLKNNRIFDFEITDHLQISSYETALMLKQPEYALVYQLDSEFLPLSELSFSKLPLSETSHENGYLFMAFKDNNDHVLKENFDMREDIYGFYIITLSNQILISASTIENVNLLKNNLFDILSQAKLKELGSFSFQDSITSDFISSDYFDILDFIESIK